MAFLILTNIVQYAILLAHGITTFAISIYFVIDTSIRNKLS